MLIVFGFKTSYQTLASAIYTCERCGHHATHRILKQRRRLSVFFVPLLAVGRARFLDECSACGRVLHISEGDAAATASGPQDAPTWSPQDR